MILGLLLVIMQMFGSTGPQEPKQALGIQSLNVIFLNRNP